MWVQVCRTPSKPVHKSQPESCKNEDEFSFHTPASVLTRSDSQTTQKWIISLSKTKLEKQLTDVRRNKNVYRVPFPFLRATVGNINLKQPSIRRLHLPHGYPKHKEGQEVQLALNCCLCCVSRRGEERRGEERRGQRCAPRNNPERGRGSGKPPTAHITDKSCRNVVKRFMCHRQCWSETTSTWSIMWERRQSARKRLELSANYRYP